MGHPVLDVIPSRYPVPKRELRELRAAYQRGELKPRESQVTEVDLLWAATLVRRAP